MQHIDTVTNTKEIVRLFAAAVQAKDIDAISSLLDGDGMFSIQNADLESLEVDTEHFLRWLRSKLLDTEITSVEYDSCIFCRVGNPVVLFNGGNFPRQIKDSSEKSMTGLMLHIVAGRIKEIAFCYSFADRENKYMFECNSDKINDLVSGGMSKIDAYFQVFYPHGIRNKEDEISWGDLYRCLVDKK
jgi:hypothetical protein